jgi:hypothetical protein
MCERICTLPGSITVHAIAKFFKMDFKSGTLFGRGRKAMTVSRASSRREVPRCRVVCARMMHQLDGDALTPKFKQP